MKHIIWVNQWFSTMYQIIKQLREGAKADGLNLHIIGTSTNQNVVYQTVCDEFWEEPKKGTSSKDYVEWCLTFCKEHQVEVFIPKRHMMAIAKRKEDFTELGVKVLVEDDIELLRNFNDKVKTAELFKELPEICKVSPFEVVTDVVAFKLSYEKLKQQLGKHSVLCVKYAEGEGASSFNIIEDGVASIRHLEMSEKHLSYEAIIQILSAVETFKPLIIMPYLKGTEISIDALKVQEGIIAVPRRKGPGRLQEICCSEELINKAALLAERFGFNQPFNLQLRYHEESLYLLEVNTRMSGGIHYGYEAGINLPYLALKKLLGQTVEIPIYPKEVVKLVYVEQPVRL